MTPRARVQASRRVAFAVLRAVDEDDAYANLVLPSRIRQAGLAPADAAFATELAYGTLRARGRYDRIVELASGRPTARIDPPVLDVLRLGVHQLTTLRTGPHAAVDESVSLVRASGHGSAAGFVNAVLRAVAREEDWETRLEEGLSGDALLGVRAAHPEWIVAALRESLAADGRGDELEALLRADNAAPRVALVALPGLAAPDEAGDPGVVSPVAARGPGGDPAAIPAVAAGRARVQDEGSQLAALALSRAEPIRAGERWLDLCAGPGGKTALLAAEALPAGATLDAVELVPARAGLVRRALRVFGDAAPAVEVADGRAVGAEHAGRYDRILLDAPCTGLGALRRRPEARWRRSASDLADLVVLQRELLDAAVHALRPGGILAYVTCSPHLDETRRQIDAALARHPGVEALDTRAVLDRIATAPLGAGVGPAVQLWPHAHGTDAMFIQLLRRTEGPRL